MKVELRAHFRKLKIYETKFCDNIRNPHHEGYEDCLYELQLYDEEYEDEKEKEEQEEKKNEKEKEDDDNSLDTAYDIVENNDGINSPIKNLNFNNF